MRMNPVYKNELKMSARSMQLPVLAVIFNSILSVVALIALYGIRQNYINSGGNPYHSMMILYVVVLTIEVVLLCLFVPSAAGGSIAGDRERQTLDILLSSRMTVREIVTGKLLSCISMAVLLVVTSIPILAVTSMYGGMQLGSCRFKKTTYASISAYGVLIVLTIGTGLLVLLLNMVFGDGFGQFSVTASVSDISCAYSSEVDMGTGVSTVHAVAGIIYLWLLNPAITYGMLISHQIGEIGIMAELLHRMGAAQVVVEHWIAVSVSVQAVFIIIMTALSAKYLDPQNERFKAGNKILKKHKSQ